MSDKGFLAEIQHTLKAPKGQYNSFGKYNYRSMEDINESLKPYLKDFGLHLIVSDEIVLIGDRYYVKATATLYKNESVIGQSTGFAREEDSKKGMDASQLTGATSSYARKYALGGLFMLDDNKDADAQQPPDKPIDKPAYKPAPQKQTIIRPIAPVNDRLDREKELARLMQMCGIPKADIISTIASDHDIQVTGARELTDAQLAQLRAYYDTQLKGEPV